MKKRKQILLLLLVTVLSVFSFTGCGDQNNTAQAADSTSSSWKLAGELRVSFLDVGQADSIFLELPDNKTMLIDAGNPEDEAYVSKYIKDAGYNRIDYVVGTHPHDDHIGGMPEIIKTFEIGSVYLPKAGNNTSTFENLLTEIENKGLKITTAKAGVNMLSDGDLSIDIVAPVKSSYEDLNNYSAVIKLKYGSTSFLFMGDAEKLSENQITADINADVLKVGHHGSEYSSSPSFIERVSPAYAVISVGKDNQYGHPADTTLKTLSAAGAAVYRTDHDGTIVFTSNGADISIEKGTPEKIEKDTLEKTERSTPEKAAQGSVTPAPENSNTSISNQQSEESGSVTVFVTNTGSKYHRDGCQYLSRSKIPMTLSDAKSAGYTPCSRCNPPQ